METMPAIQIDAFGEDAVLCWLRSPTETWYSIAPNIFAALQVRDRDTYTERLLKNCDGTPRDVFEKLKRIGMTGEIAIRYSENAEVAFISRHAWLALTS